MKYSIIPEIALVNMPGQKKCFSIKNIRLYQKDILQII